MELTIIFTPSGYKNLIHRLKILFINHYCLIQNGNNYVMNTKFGIYSGILPWPISYDFCNSSILISRDKILVQGIIKSPSNDFTSFVLQENKGFYKSINRFSFHIFFTIFTYIFLFRTNNTVPLYADTHTRICICIL